MTDQLWHAAGEVTDREDLLDGRVRLEVAGNAGDAVIEAGFAWRRGRDSIALEAADSYLTVLEGDRELHATALGGTVTEEPDTAAARVHAQFIVEDAVGLGATDMPIAAILLIGPEEWSGEFQLGMRLPSSAPPPGAGSAER